MTRGELYIRKGTLADHPQVLEFTQATFSWGDYLPGAWNHWVKSKRGDLLVATVQDKVVGTLHVRYLGNDEAWLEGVRVHPGFRQRGIAGVLIDAAHKRAIRKKCRTISLETQVRNTAARRAFEKFGYQVVVEYGGYSAGAHDGELKGVRLAELQDASGCWDWWQHSWLKRASKKFVPSVYGWRWWEYTRSRLADDIRARRVWVAPHAFMVLRDMDEDLDVIMLVGARRDAVKLLIAAQTLAHQMNKPQVFWNVPLAGWAEEWAKQAHYDFDDDGHLIYARDLK